jgi:predicted DNA-binding transcriptional regulator AlpA
MFFKTQKGLNMQATSFRKKLERDPPGSKLDQLSLRSFQAALRATQLKAASGDPAHSKSLPQTSAAPRTLVQSAAIPATQAIPVAVADSPAPQTNRSQRRQADLSDADLEGPGFIRLPAVLRLLNISRSGWYSGIQRGHFPPGSKLTLDPKGRAVGYLRSDIKALLERLSNGAVP